MKLSSKRAVDGEEARVEGVSLRVAALWLRDCADGVNAHPEWLLVKGATREGERRRCREIENREINYRIH